MADEERLRREADLTVDKTMRITPTVGSLLAVIAAVWFIGRWTDESEDARVLMRQEIHEVLDIAERNERRLQTWIDRNDESHGDMYDVMDDHHHEAAVLREYLGARFGEMLP